MPQAKTNAIRTLDARNISYEIFSYDASVTSADGVAAVFGVSPAEVYKTLVMLRDDGRAFLVMVPGDREVTPRILAAALGVKSVRMAPKSEAERLTGLQTGGIGALALLGKPFDVYLDRVAAGRDTLYVNAGRRGVNVRIGVADLMAITGARFVDTS